LASAAALMLTVGQWLVPGTPAVAATVPAWNCPAPDLTTGYAFEKDKGSGPHEIQEIDPRSHHFASVATTPQAVDAVGFNDLDHYFYGVLPDHGSLVRIGADGSLETVRSLTAPLPEAGDIDPQGHYWVAGGGQWREYDLDPGSGAFGSELAGGTLTVPGGLTAPGDWSYMSTGPYGPGLYGVAAAIGGGQPVLAAGAGAGQQSEEEVAVDRCPGDRDRAPALGERLLGVPVADRVAERRGGVRVQAAQRDTAGNPLSRAARITLR